MTGSLRRGILLIPLLTLLFSCSSGGTKEPRTRSEFVLGTTCVITLFDWAPGKDPDALLDEAFLLLDQLDRQFNAHSPDSEVSRINDAGGRGYRPEPEVLLVLKTALELADWSDGRFDPSIGRLVTLWGIGTEQVAVPSPEALEQALATGGYDSILVEEDGTVRLSRPGMRLDLGAIAKGFAADKVRDRLLEQGGRSALINLGGNVLPVGRKVSGDPWRIGIQDPEEPRGAFIGILSVEDKAVVTSGVYERNFEEGEKLYHHILDTGTGFPVDNDVLSTTIIHPRSMMADGLSTALFAMGVDGGMRAAETLEDTAVIMVDRQKRVHITDNLRESFALSSQSDYSLAP